MEKEDREFMSDKSGYIWKPFSATAKRRESADLSQVMFGKIPPQARDLEEVVLGSLMLDADAITSVAHILKAETFYVCGHQLIYQAICNLFAKNDPIDILTVTEQLKKMGSLEEAGGAYYLMELTNEVTSSANIERHAFILKEKFIQRELIRVSSEVIKDSYDETTDVFELLQKSMGDWDTLMNDAIPSQQKDWRAVVEEAGRDARAAAEKADDEKYVIGTSTGVFKLDKYLSGYCEPDLIIMAGRPGEGKTTLALEAVQRNCIELGIDIGMFSLEMSAKQLFQKFMSKYTGIPVDRIRKGKLTWEEWQQYNKGEAEWLDAPFHINDTGGININELMAIAKAWVIKYDIKLLIVDYLQLVTTADKGLSREQQVSSISAKLKKLAKDLGIPVLLLSQMSRDIEKRGKGARPQLSDLRESGAIEQDADVVIFIYRPWMHGIYEDDAGQSTVGLGELHIAKFRLGPPGMIEVGFDGRGFKDEYISTGDLFDQQQPTDLKHSSARPEGKNDSNTYDEDIPF